MAKVKASTVLSKIAALDKRVRALEARKGKSKRDDDDDDEIVDDDDDDE